MAKTRCQPSIQLSQKGEEGMKSSVSMESSLARILSSSEENQRKHGARLSSSSSSSSLARFDPKMPPSLPEAGLEHPALGVRSIRAVLSALTRVFWLPLALLITPGVGAKRKSWF